MADQLCPILGDRNYIQMVGYQYEDEINYKKNPIKLNPYNTEGKPIKVGFFHHQQQTIYSDYELI